MMDYFTKKELDKVIDESSVYDVLTEIGDDIVLEYVKDYLDIKYRIETNEEAIEALKKIGKFIAHNRYLDKEDLKKELCEFIDFWHV